MIRTGTVYEVIRDLMTNLGLFLYRNSQVGADTDVYGAAVSARYRMLEWLYLIASYQFTYQRGLLGASTSVASNQGDRIYHNVVLVGFEVSEPYRLY